MTHKKMNETPEQRMLLKLSENLLQLAEGLELVCNEVGGLKKRIEQLEKKESE